MNHRLNFVKVWLLQKYLDMTIQNNSDVRKQDGYRVITGVSHNTVGRLAAVNCHSSAHAQRCDVAI